jgi:hypothetical protein
MAVKFHEKKSILCVLDKINKNHVSKKAILEAPDLFFNTGPPSLTFFNEILHEQMEHGHKFV